MSQKTPMEQLDEKNIYTYAKFIEAEVRSLQNTNEILQSKLHQFKIKIAKLEEKDIQSDKDSYEALKKTHSYYRKTIDLEIIIEQLSREIDLNSKTKKLRELNDEDKRKLRPRQ